MMKRPKAKALSWVPQVWRGLVEMVALQEAGLDALFSADTPRVVGSASSGESYGFLAED